MNKKVIYVAVGVVVLGFIFWGGMMGGSKESAELLQDGDVEMKQIDVVNPSFQAGQADIGSTEEEYGYYNEDGVRMLNGKPVQQVDENGDIPPFDFAAEPEPDDEPQIVDPKFEFTDEE